jgi:hypothetical protein
MYKYKHKNTFEIIEIADLIVGSPEKYFDSPYVKYWWHINDITKEIDNYSNIDNPADEAYALNTYCAKCDKSYKSDEICPISKCPFCGHIQENNEDIYY